MALKVKKHNSKVPSKKPASAPSTQVNNCKRKRGKPGQSAKQIVASAAQKISTASWRALLRCLQKGKSNAKSKARSKTVEKLVFIFDIMHGVQAQCTICGEGNGYVEMHNDVVKDDMLQDGVYIARLKWTVLDKGEELNSETIIAEVMRTKFLGVRKDVLYKVMTERPHISKTTFENLVDMLSSNPSED